MLFIVPKRITSVSRRDVDRMTSCIGAIVSATGSVVYAVAVPSATMTEMLGEIDGGD